MTILSIQYHGKEDRAEKVKLNEAKNLRMLHDNFDLDWQPGTEPHGTMIFTDEPEKVTPQPLTRDLAAEIDNLKARVAILEKR